MSTASIPATGPATSGPGAPGKPTASGVEGLFELITQSMDFSLQADTQPGPAATDAGEPTRCCVEQCLAELDLDKSLLEGELPELETDFGQETSTAADAAENTVAPLLTAPPNSISDTVVERHFTKAASIPAVAAMETPDTGPQNTHTTATASQAHAHSQANPNPMTRALDALNASSQQSLPAQAADKAGLASQTQSSVAGLNQAREQLEANLARWNSEPRGNNRAEAISPAAAALANSAATASGSLLATAQSGATASSIPQFSLPGSIHHPAWQNALAERVVMLTHQGIHQAELKLHPAELGSVSVRLENLQDGAQSQTQLQFAALNADTREALEAALPRLREMFNQQGMNLVRADIQQGFSQTGGDAQTSGQTQQNATQSASTADAEAAAAEQRMDNRQRLSDRILDLYA